jgi:chaperonin GroEL
VPDYIDDKSNFEIFDDIATVTGSKLCTRNDLYEFSPEEIFGVCKKATIAEYETLLIGPAGDKEEIRLKLNDLRNRIRTEDSKVVKGRLKQRLSNLEGKTGLILVGGYTEVEVSENRDKIIDCLNSCKSAIEHGILPGGGTAFIHALKVLDTLKYDNVDINAGIKIFKEAIIVILTNLEYSSSSI